MLDKFKHFLLGLVQKYPVVLAGIFIYGYYLTTTVNFFEHNAKRHGSFLDFVLQFDSLIWMWLAAFAFIKLQGMKDRSFNEEKERLTILHEVEHSTLASNLLRNVTNQLQDEINNPLAVISVMTTELRRRSENDLEIVRRLDQIDSSSRRIHLAIKNVESYQVGQLLSKLQQKIASEGLKESELSLQKR